MSSASTSAVSLANAFFDPSGLVPNVSPRHPKTRSFHIPDKGVDLDCVNIIEFLQCLLDLSLVGLDVDNENQCVVLLDLLHGALGIEGVDDDLVLIETRLVRNGLSWVFWGT